MQRVSLILLLYILGQLYFIYGCTQYLQNNVLVIPNNATCILSKNKMWNKHLISRIEIYGIMEVHDISPIHLKFNSLEIKQGGFLNIGPKNILNNLITFEEIGDNDCIINSSERPGYLSARGVEYFTVDLIESAYAGDEELRVDFPHLKLFVYQKLLLTNYGESTIYEEVTVKNVIRNRIILEQPIIHDYFISNIGELQIYPTVTSLFQDFAGIIFKNLCLNAIVEDITGVTFLDMKGMKLEDIDISDSLFLSEKTHEKKRVFDLKLQLIDNSFIKENNLEILLNDQQAIGTFLSEVENIQISTENLLQTQIFVKSQIEFKVHSNFIFEDSIFQQSKIHIINSSGISISFSEYCVVSDLSLFSFENELSDLTIDNSYFISSSLDLSLTKVRELVITDSFFLGNEVVDNLIVLQNQFCQQLHQQQIISSSLNDSQQSDDNEEDSSDNDIDEDGNDEDSSDDSDEDNQDKHFMMIIELSSSILAGFKKAIITSKQCSSQYSTQPYLMATNQQNINYYVTVDSNIVNSYSLLENSDKIIINLPSMFLENIFESSSLYLSKIEPYNLRNSYLIKPPIDYLGKYTFSTEFPPSYFKIIGVSFANKSITLGDYDYKKDLTIVKEFQVFIQTNNLSFFKSTPNQFIQILSNMKQHIVILPFDEEPQSKNIIKSKDINYIEISLFNHEKASSSQNEKTIIIENPSRSIKNIIVKQILMNGQLEDIEVNSSINKNQSIQFIKHYNQNSLIIHWNSIEGGEFRFIIEIELCSPMQKIGANGECVFQCKLENGISLHSEADQTQHDKDQSISQDKSQTIFDLGLICSISCGAGYTQIPYENNNTCSRCPRGCKYCEKKQGNKFVCLECFEGYISESGACLDICNQANYIDNFKCLPCMEGCQHCNNKNSCISCYSVSSDYQCMQCAIGEYSNKMKCKQCHFSCARCIGKSEYECISCAKGYKRSGIYCLKIQSTLMDHTICNQNEIEDELSSCKNCSQECMVCSSSSCNKCKIGYFKKSKQSLCQVYQNKVCKEYENDKCLSCPPHLYLLDSQCQEFCPLGYFSKEIISNYQKACFLCDFQACIECSESPTKCTKCRTNQKLIDNTCIKSCKKGQFINQQGICSPCNLSKCQECINYDSKCTKCNEGKYLLNFECVYGCPQGYFIKTDHCQLCFPNCSSCINSEEQCTSCQYPLILFNFSCLERCTEGFFTSIKDDGSLFCDHCDTSVCKTCINNSISCTSCSNGLFLHEMECIENCPERYHQDNKEVKCIQCKQLNCLECLESSEYCSKCSNDFIIQKGVCVQQCSSGFFLEITNSKQCKECNLICLECEGNSDFCTKCYPYHFSLGNGTCSINCPPNTYQVQYSHLNFTCKLCDQSCNGCSGPNKSDCLGAQRLILEENQDILLIVTFILCILIMLLGGSIAIYFFVKKYIKKKQNQQIKLKEKYLTPQIQTNAQIEKNKQKLNIHFQPGLQHLHQGDHQQKLMSNRANLNVHPGFEVLSRMNSIESEKEIPRLILPLNEKKGRFFKSFLIDGEQPMLTFRIKANNGSIRGKRILRKNTVLEEQRGPLVLQHQEKQRRKSAEGSLFGFLNGKITFLSSLAPLHPNHIDPESHAHFKLDLSQSRRKRSSRALKDSEELKSSYQTSTSATDLHRLIIIQEQSNNNNMIKQGNDYSLKNSSTQNREQTPLCSQVQTEKSQEKQQNNNNRIDTINFNIQAQKESLEETPNHFQPKTLKNLLAFKPSHQNSKQIPLSNRRNVSNWFESKSIIQENDSVINNEKIVNRESSQHQQKSGSSAQDLRGIFQNPLQYKNNIPKQREDSFSTSLSNNQALINKKNSSNQTISKFIFNTTTSSKTLTQIVSEISSQNFTQRQERFSQPIKGKRNRNKLLPLSFHEFPKKKVKHHPQLALNYIYIANNPLYQKKPVLKKISDSVQIVSPKVNQVGECSDFSSLENNNQRVVKLDSKPLKSRVNSPTMLNLSQYASFTQLSSQNKYSATTLIKQKNFLAFHHQ